MDNPGVDNKTLLFLSFLLEDKGDFKQAKSLFGPLLLSNMFQNRRVSSADAEQIVEPHGDFARCNTRAVCP